MCAPNQILSGQAKKAWPVIRIIKNLNEHKIDTYIRNSRQKH